MKGQTERETERERETDRQTEEKDHLVDFVEVSIRAEESLIETSVRGEK
jgi:hypothetical protein